MFKSISEEGKSNECECSDIYEAAVKRWNLIIEEDIEMQKMSLKERRRSFHLGVLCPHLYHHGNSRILY